MTRSWQFALSIVVVCGIAGGTDARAQSAAPVTASTTVPRSVPFTGQVVTPKGEARTGTVALTFALYTDQQDGVPIWTEQQQVTLDNEGRYSLVLGSVSADGLPADAFAAGTPRWLGVQVEAEKEQPRMMLLSVPYALKAGDADTIGGKPISDFVLNTRLFDSVTSTLKEAGYPPRPSNPAASTVGRLAKFIDTSNNTGDSVVIENAGNIGINTSPLYPFHVVASSTYQAERLDTTHPVGSSFTLGPTAAGAHVYSFLATGPAASTGAGYFTIYDEGFGQYRMVINPSGNVGIGTTNPTNKVHIVGATSRALYGTTTSSAEAVRGDCLTAGNACYGVEGLGLSSNYGGVFYGGHGIYASANQDDAGGHGVEAHSNGGSAYALYGLSADYRGLNAESDPAYYAAILTGSSLGFYTTGDSTVVGNLNVTGTVTGPTGEPMQNVDGSQLETGDVVVVSGTSDALSGDAPVLSVRKATAAYDTGVAGVVERGLYVPDAATKATYEAEQSALRAATSARVEADRKAIAAGVKMDHSKLPIPSMTISDAQGTVHSTQDTTVAPGGYARLVTRGTFKTVKVDAGFGAIHVGDLLTTSSNPGHAMKVTDKVAAIGAIIGKALGNLEQGTGTIPVMITAK